jgi:hypothetical protein
MNRTHTPEDVEKIQSGWRKRQIQMRITMDDDDIQEYVRPCPNCEYHRKRAQHWRDEAYKQAGYPLPEREWVGLTDEEWLSLGCKSVEEVRIGLAIQAKLKEKNT